MKRLPKVWQRAEKFREPTTTKVMQGYLNFFEPDVFVQSAEGQLEQLELTADDRWDHRKRFRSIESMIRTEPGRAPFFDVGVSMHHAYEHMFKTEFQFKKRQDPKILSFSGGDRVGRAFFEVAYGMFPDVDGLGYIQDYYRGAFAAETAAPSIETWETIEGKGAGFPLYYTTRDLDQRFEGDWDEHVFIFDPLNACDVLDFWNMRLFRSDIMPVNVHWLRESRPLILEKIREKFRPLPSNPNGVMISTTLHLGRSLKADEVVKVLDFPTADVSPGSVSLQTWHPAIWLTPPMGDRMFRPVAAPLIAKQQEAQLVPDPTDQSVRLPLLSPDFLEFTRGSGPGWVNVVRTRFYGANSKYAEAMPSAAIESNEHYPPRGYGVQIPTKEGHVTFHNYPQSGSSFRLATSNEAIFGWLRGKSIVAEQSDAGRIAEELINSVGGLSSAVLLAHPEAINQFDSMARSRLTYTDGSTEEFPDRTATIGQLDSMVRRIKKKPYGSHVDLGRFVDAGVLQLGIAAKCSHCTKENWYSLDDVGMTLKCERCLKSFPYPQGEPPRRDAWKYRVVGAFATPHFAQGGYSVALTLRFLEHEIGSLEEFTYATGLNFTIADQRLETDFFAWHGKHAFTRASQDPVLLVGECKSFGTEVFKAKDIERLKQLGTLLEGAFLVVATLKPTLEKREIACLRSLCRWGWKRGQGDQAPSPVIILTGTELFSIGPLHNAWLDAGGRQAEVARQYSYIHDFHTLARATRQAALGFTNDEMSQMVYRSRRRLPPVHAVGVNIRV